MRYFLFTDKDWQHAKEFLTEAEAHNAWRSALDGGYETCRVAAVYAAPRREIFNAHMSHQCRLVCAGIPSPFQSTVVAPVQGAEAPE